MYILDEDLFITNSVYKINEPEESIVVTYNTNYQTQHTIRHRAPDVLPTFENSSDDLDNLDDVSIVCFIHFHLCKLSVKFYIHLRNIFKTFF